MDNNNLTKAFPVRLTQDQNKALNILQNKGFNRSKFIRKAINEKLYKDYRVILREVIEEESKISNAPNWLYDN